jgi:acetyl-CoA C-acetyltransferase
LVGGEGIYSRRHARETGAARQVTRQSGIEPDERFGLETDMSSDLEKNAGFTAPVHFYALFENAWRAHLGETVEGNREQIAELMARFNAIARVNPDAWSHEVYTAEEIRNAAPDNRMVCFPYTKRMCSNWFTDQAAAVILCSVEAARRLAIPSNGWVFPQSGTDANDTTLVSNRQSLAASPAIRLAGRTALRLAAVDAAEIEHVDLYSCFPSAIQIAAHELGLAPNRPLSVTGGMAYFGGPLSNYVTHSLTSMVAILRGQPGSRGLVTANGGYLTKHAFGIYSTDPPVNGYRYLNVQNEVNVLPTVPVAFEVGEPVTTEATTVAFDRDGSGTVLLACRTDDGRRLWAHSDDVDAVRAAVSAELKGTSVHIGSNGMAQFDL